MPRIIKNNILHAELSYKLNGIFFKIHNKLGRFRNEKQYADALEYELSINNMNYQREKEKKPCQKVFPEKIKTEIFQILSWKTK